MDLEFLRLTYLQVYSFNSTTLLPCVEFFPAIYLGFVLQEIAQRSNTACVREAKRVHYYDCAFRPSGYECEFRYTDLPKLYLTSHSNGPRLWLVASIRLAREGIGKAVHREHGRGGRSPPGTSESCFTTQLASREKSVNFPLTSG